MPEGCAERRIPFTADSLATAAALCAASGETHVLYENRDVVSWAEGERAVVEVAGDGLFLTTSGKREELTALPHPLAAAGKALAQAGSGNWRAYGWTSFELNRYPRVTADSGPLARFVLPLREIRLGQGHALLRAADEAALDELEARLGAAVVAMGTPARADRVVVDIAGHGALEYQQAVAGALAEIRGGALEKVILSRVVPVPGEIDLPATFLAGRRNNAPARSFLLRSGEWETAGFSPEIVAEVTAAGVVVTQPLAGTRALAGEITGDHSRREELYRDAKEVFEHAISVRLAAAELATVCEAGTVHVEDFMSVKERGSVQHLASEVTGRLAGGVTSWDALAALFPAVTASGIPKAVACELISRFETRGLYSGAVMTADADGTLDAALVLRSVFRHRGKTWLRAGAGIVAQSDPSRELEETREKLRSVSQFLVPARVPVAKAAS